jgi:hypothetical protein
MKSLLRKRLLDTGAQLQDEELDHILFIRYEELKFEQVLSEGAFGVVFKGTSQL